jgi:hypothetical protein
MVGEDLAVSPSGFFVRFEDWMELPRQFANCAADG